MEENKRQCRIGYNKAEDSYVLYISTDGGETCGYSLGCKCVRREGEPKDAEPMYVNIGLIEKLKEAISLGYEVVY